MKKFRFLFSLALTMTVLVFATRARCQTFDNSCTQDRFPYAMAYGQIKGFGGEVGMWPQDKILGFAAGFDFVIRTVPFQKTYEDNVEYVKDTRATTYVKGLLRLHRFVYLTGTAGATMDLNGHAAAGIRFSLPIASGSRLGMVVEPQYGTQGFNFNAGIAIAL
jgi:hypothetical protein